MNEKPFNPAEHLTTISKRRKVKDPNTGQERWLEEKTLYLETKWRLMWFRNVFPDGFIDTKEIEVTDEYARIEATVYDRDPDDGGRRLGKGRRQVWATDTKYYVSTAETMAIGRSLASAGFGSQFCDEFDEDDLNIADSPIKAGEHPIPLLESKAPKVPDASTIYKTAARKGLSREDTDLLIKIRYQQDYAEHLNDEERIEFLKGLQDNSKDRLTSFVSRVKASMIEGPSQVA
ncbi:MAG: hypothetical protein HPY50_16870 [Firmicutes bacterium]|nr:hypothetical protein [Bacillota bacterium]